MKELEQRYGKSKCLFLKLKLDKVYTEKLSHLTIPSIDFSNNENENNKRRIHTESSESFDDRNIYISFYYYDLY